VLSFSSPRRESASIGASGKFHGFETYTNDESGIKRRPGGNAPKGRVESCHDKATAKVSKPQIAQE
jgi:hypothetical protein